MRLSPYCCTVHESNAYTSWPGLGLRLGRHGDVDLAADGGEEIEFHLDLVLLGPGVHQLLHGGVAGGHPVIPEREAQFACRAGGADMHQWQRGRCRAQLERGSARQATIRWHEVHSLRGRDRPGRLCVRDCCEEAWAARAVSHAIVSIVAGANRYAAEQLQKHYLDSFESAVPVRKDFEVSDDDLRSHDVIFVGRVETNSALAAWKGKIGLESGGGMFRIAGKDHASETEALAFAATNPLDRHHMVLVLAGNNALETVRLAGASLNRTEYTIYDSAKETSSGFR